MLILFNRVRLHPVASRVESVSERHKTRSLVEVDRKSELEAAVVRIMKEAKTLHQNALIAKVIEQVKHRFAPTPGDIKKSIESLCSREFLERSQQDRSFFTTPRYLQAIIFGNDTLNILLRKVNIFKSYLNYLREILILFHHTFLLYFNLMLNALILK